MFAAIVGPVAVLGPNALVQNTISFPLGLASVRSEAVSPLPGRLLVETGPLKIPGHESVPTFRELGYPLSVEVFYGIVGPAKLPPDAIKWWDALLAEISRTREYAELCDKIFALPSYADSASFKRMVTGGYADFGKALTK